MTIRLRIIDTNFTTKHDWLFKLSDENGNDFYIMNQAFYKSHNLKSPITKKELDYYDRGQWITATTVQINDKRIVTSI
jgi:translation elongation factor P/translation initiation factor 5A